MTSLSSTLSTVKNTLLNLPWQDSPAISNEKGEIQQIEFPLFIL
jgi:hypothetical protein